MAERKVKKRLYYKIGEACKLLDIQPYVLRYWETEFPSLKPEKSRSGQRVYSERELELIRRIKELLYDEGYTIAGAKKRLEGEVATGGGFRKSDTPDISDSSDESELRNPAAPAPAPQGELDSSTAERIEHLRKGIGEALDEARSILALLEPGTP